MPFLRTGALFLMPNEHRTAPPPSNFRLRTAMDLYISGKAHVNKGSAINYFPRVAIQENVY